MPTWLLLAIAIGSEVIGTSALRESDGFTRPPLVCVTVVTYALAFYLLAVVVRDYPLGLTYAIWAGAGTALIAVVGVVAFDESFGLAAGLGIALIIVGILVINLGAGV
jgi:small multidrug resistance pump